MLLAIILYLYVRQWRRRQRTDIERQAAVVTPLTYNTGARQPVGDLKATERLNRRESTSLGPENQREYLTAQLRQVQKQLEFMQGNIGNGSANLQEAMQQNEALRTRIRTLERELQSQLGLELSDHSPPGYLD